LRELRPAGDTRMTVGHGHDTSLVHRQDKKDFLLIGDGADEFLPARPGQTEYIIDSVGGRDFQISLRGDFFLRHSSMTPFRRGCSNVQGFKVQRVQIVSAKPRTFEPLNKLPYSSSTAKPI